MTTTPESERELIEPLRIAADSGDHGGWASDMMRHAVAAIERLAEERDTAQAECLEQARLLDMSATREAKMMAERDSLKQKCERRDEELGVYVLQVEKLRERAEAIDALEAWIKRDTIGPQTRALIAVRRFNDTGTIDFDAENPWTVKRIGGRGTTLHEAIRAALEQAEPGSTT